MRGFLGALGAHPLLDSVQIASKPDQFTPDPVNLADHPALIAVAPPAIGAHNPCDGIGGYGGHFRIAHMSEAVL
jgi:hypothetical protein